MRQELDLVALPPSGHSKRTSRERASPTSPAHRHIPLHHVNHHRRSQLTHRIGFEASAPAASDPAGGLCAGVPVQGRHAQVGVFLAGPGLFSQQAHARAHKKRFLVFDRRLERSVLTSTEKHTHTHAHTRRHRQTHTRTHTRRHRQTHTHTHTKTCARTQGRTYARLFMDTTNTNRLMDRRGDKELPSNIDKAARDREREEAIRRTPYMPPARQIIQAGGRGARVRRSRDFQKGEQVSESYVPDPTRWVNHHDLPLRTPRLKSESDGRGDGQQPPTRLQQKKRSSGG